jgi:hypothetical protein
MRCHPFHPLPYEVPSVMLRSGLACAALLLPLTMSGCALVEPADGAAELDEQLSTSITADPLDIPGELQDRIDEVQADCQCFGSLTSWSVFPVSPAADVFDSFTVLEAIVGQDIQLPWAAAGAINPLALDNLLGSEHAGLIDELAAAGDPAGGDFELGAHKWSHPTQPDFCSSETIYQMYFPATGVLFAFRFDSSAEC